MKENPRTAPTRELSRVPVAWTAAIAGIRAWYFGGFLANLAMMNMGLFPQKLGLVGLVGLVEYVVAAVAGAFVYKEAESSSLSTGRALLSGTPAPQR